MSPTYSFQDASQNRLPWPQARCVERPLVLLAMSVGLLLGILPLASTATVAEVSEGSTAANGLADGTYVFGESPNAGQPGTTYMVMEVVAQEIIGGFYQPSSSFDCFQGHVSGDTMLLTVVDSYEQTTHALNLPLQAATPVASQTAAPTQFVPRGFHRMSDIADMDEVVLATCQKTF